MPDASYVKMRDKFIRDGLSSRIAKQKSSRIFNTKRPQLPVKGATDNRDNRDDRDNRGGVE